MAGSPVLHTNAGRSERSDAPPCCWLALAPGESASKAGGLQSPLMRNHEDRGSGDCAGRPATDTGVQTKSRLFAQRVASIARGTVPKAAPSAGLALRPRRRVVNEAHISIFVHVYPFTGTQSLRACAHNPIDCSPEPPPARLPRSWRRPGRSGEGILVVVGTRRWNPCVRAGRPWPR